MAGARDRAVACLLLKNSVASSSTTPLPPSLPMSHQTLRTVFFAATLLAAHMHCVALHAVQSHAAALASSDTMTVPIRPISASCENESGCICKGATLVAPAQAPSLEMGLPDVSFGASPEGIDLTATNSFRGLDSPSPPRWPTSAQTVRALLQSYQL